MASKKRLIQRKLKRIFKPSIGKLLCILTLAYFVYGLYSYSNRVEVSYYEVEEGSLVKEHNYTGLILRDEEIVNSEANGYIYFFVADGRKAAKNSPVYSIDEGGKLQDYINTHADELNQLNSARVADIRAEILNYSRSFEPADFRSLYNIKSTLDAHTIEYASMNIFSSLEDRLSSAGIAYRQFDAPATGIVCAYTDGYESVTEDDINAGLFDTDNYNKQTIKAGDLVTSGSPVYKLITDESWKIIFPVDENDTNEFSDGDTVKLSFSDKGFTVKSRLNFITGTDGRRFGVIALDSYVIQFTSDRFVNFEIVTNDVSGLKIPDKAVTSKDFYVIPASYLVTDDNGNKGFYKAVVGAEGTSAQFVMPEIFNLDDEYAYIDCDDKDCPLKPGDYILPNAGYTVNAAAMAEADTRAQQITESITETESAADDTVEETIDGADIADSPETEDSKEAVQESTDNSDDKAKPASDDESIADNAEKTEQGNEAEGTVPDSASSEEAQPEGTASGTKSEDASQNLENETDTETDKPSAANADVPSGLYQINAKQGLKGAYNVNKGYTVFKKVEILETANGYSIVKKNSSYGLQVYDHIVLDASTVHDGQLLYR